MYLATLVPVVLGVAIGFEVFVPGRTIPYGEDSLLLRFAAWDGGQFMSIMENGYSFQSGKISNIVLFPGYPVLGMMTRFATRLTSAASLLLVSHAALISAMILFHRYVWFRFHHAALADASTWALAILPPTFFWRMAYSESTFVLLEVMVLYGIRRKWPLPAMALIAGLSTAIRLVGVALLIPLAFEFASRRRTENRPLLRACLMLPVAVGGLLAFMVFQWIEFGDALRFAKGQDAFYLRAPVGSVQHWSRLFTLEPIWATWLQGSDCFWRLHAPKPGALLNLQFWNPIWFCATAALVFHGWFKRILTDAESAMGAALLIIPYIGRAEEFCMGSQARYASVALPAVMVLGYLSRKWSAPWKVGLIVVSTSFLAAWSAFFAAWYFFL